jgi:hypothetical protein
MSVLGSEPTPYANEPSESKRAASLLESRAKHVVIARATKEICESEGIVYVPLHEAFAQLLRERDEQGLKLTFTMDGSHPNLLGNWLVGAALLQCLGFEPERVTVEVLQGEAASDHGRLSVSLASRPVRIRFESLFLEVVLVPPPEPRVVCRRAAAPITLDGRTDDWQGIDEHTISPPANVTWELVPRCAHAYKASVRTCYDDAFLYFAFRVKEPDVGEGETFPEIVEVFIDARKDTSVSGNVWRQTPGLTQFVFHRSFSDAAKGPGVRVGVNGDRSQGDGVRAAVARSDDGYVIEAAIPLASFKQIAVKPGVILPWDWAVSFTDQSVNLDWLGLMSRSQSTRGYGELLLAPANEPV